MNTFVYRAGELCAEGVAVHALAERFGTPCYVYSKAALESRWRAFDQALGNHPHLICYAVKANGNLAVLNVLARLGSGFDIVSGGELARVLRAGGDPAKVVFSGVGKQDQEMRQALAVGIRCFNVESEAELATLNRIAGELGVRAPVAIRINPDIDAATHPYISTGLKQNKFGIDITRARAAYHQAADLAHLRVVGLSCHIGSQLITLKPFADSLDRILTLTGQLQADGIGLTHLDLGGGLGIRYHNEEPPSPWAYAALLRERLDHHPYDLLLEPGRAIVGNAGILLTRVLLIKATEVKNFAIVDAGMNDLLRPALYDAWHEVWPAAQDDPSNDPGESQVYDLVGPVCETGDWLAKDRRLTLKAGDLLAVMSVGAYGFAMASTYNARPRPAEVMVDRANAHLVRGRETLDQLMAGEAILPAC